MAGRPLAQNHFEMIADEELGLGLGERLRLGKDTYTVVGLTRGMVSSGGDGIACFSSRDALAIQFDEPGESVRLERQARRARAEKSTSGGPNHRSWSVPRARLDRSPRCRRR